MLGINPWSGMGDGGEAEGAKRKQELCARYQIGHLDEVLRARALGQSSRQAPISVPERCVS
jgi:hypothetical protein